MYSESGIGIEITHQRRIPSNISKPVLTFKKKDVIRQTFISSTKTFNLIK